MLSCDSLALDVNHAVQNCTECKLCCVFQPLSINKCKFVSSQHWNIGLSLLYIVDFLFIHDVLGNNCRDLEHFTVALLTNALAGIYALARHLYRNEKAVWPISHISIKLCRHNHPQKEADAAVCGRGGVRCPHLTPRQWEGERDGAMKMTDENANGRAVIGRKGEGRQTSDNTDSWAGLPVRPDLVFPSWFASPRWDTCQGHLGTQEQVS